jgi:phosphate transport system permease protein
MTTTTDVKAGTPTPPKSSRRHKARQRSRRNQVVVEVIGALIVAVGVMFVARAGFGVDSPLALGIIGYLGFVATVAIVEFADRSQPETVIDLTEGAQAPIRKEPRPLAAVPDDPNDDVPIKRRSISSADVVEAGIAALGAAAVAEFIRITIHMRSTMGVLLWWYVAFIVLFFLLTRERTSAETAFDRVMTVVIWSGGIVVAAVLTWMIFFILFKGLPKLTAAFFTHDLSKTGPLTPGGGAEHAIIGTLEQVGIATLIIVPIGVLTAVYLHEINGRMARPVRFITDAMSGLPSIVAGLLIFTIWAQNHGYSGAAGAAALAVLMLPTMTRASEEILRTVPDTLREGALALGAPHHRLVRKVVLPTAIAGLVTAMLLAIARAVGETAPMIMTAFGADATNTNPLKGPQEDLPLFVYKLIFVPNATQNQRAFTGALILVGLVLVLFAAARIVSGRGARKLQGARR